jgi:hypothetical protein
MPSEPRSFTVHLEDDARHCRRIEGDSFEDAALVFAEELHGEDEVVLIVTDEADGRRQCLRVDLGSGEAGACS